MHTDKQYINDLESTYIDNAEFDVKISEELNHVSNEALEIELKL